MPLHLIKLSVGVRDLDHLAEVQDRRAVRVDGQTRIPVHTRSLPKRADEIVAGGSLYWVIKGSIAARQRVLAIDSGVDGEGQGFCLFQLDALRVPTVPTPHRPFQGWRYLNPDAAPPDLAAAAPGEEALPPHLVAELRALGLL
ncbi:DUF1489 family protein [Azospirillum griseum]|uniref:DUF1489 family protein n=1 Tax=Azospirillum griseum TaxID=2496639 RepID=A0A3S0R8T7_9PROT|nr:DUF1489 domain-containing protein [Azospirillum griseum]RTR19906.1 DUF1489 family protein [Azospirillum griseum]